MRQEWTSAWCILDKDSGHRAHPPAAKQQMPSQLEQSRAASTGARAQSAAGGAPDALQARAQQVGDALQRARQRGTRGRRRQVPQQLHQRQRDRRAHRLPAAVQLPQAHSMEA